MKTKATSSAKVSADLNMTKFTCNFNNLNMSNFNNLTCLKHVRLENVDKNK